ncbi:hypothetical protein [Paraburkholderia caribensis]|uniref:hypothetical protein n=1 Tax=Paraburkholderia caribensis TaxID=75105 RepID=UPI0034D1C297
MTLVPRYGIEDDWFDESLPVQVSNVSQVAGYLGVTLPLNNAALLHFSGGFKGSQVSCKMATFPNTGKTALLFETSHPAWLLPRFKNQVWLLKVNNQFELYIDFIAFARATPPGLSTLMVWRMVRICAEWGIRRISLWAAGGRDRDLAGDKFPDGRRWGGYYFWPSIGFEGKLETTDLYFFGRNFRFPDGIDSATTVRTVFELDNGKGSHFWRYNGNDVEKCEFLVDGGQMTRSMEILAAKVQNIIIGS